jgi:hypothetical protein
MARVVQRRTPPYLAIVFAILMVTSMVLMVLFFNKWSNADKENKRRADLINHMATAQERNGALFRQMFRNYDDAKGNVPPTVFAQMLAQNGELARIVTGGSSAAHAEAIQDTNKTYEQLGIQVRNGLTKHMMQFSLQLSEKDADVARLTQEKAALAQQLAKAGQDLTALKTDFDTKLAQKDQQIESLDQKFQNFETAQNQKLTDAKKDYSSSVSELTKQVASHAAQGQKLQRDVVVWKKKYEALLKNKPDRILDAGKVARRPDGKILRILSGEGLVYINIGSKDRVAEDLRLTVYPYTGIPESGAGKAVIEVTDVGENVSECRILLQSKGEPIVTGDLVANVVYDALRNYNFVVEGDFDLDNKGDTTPAGNKAIRELVRRYGGRVISEISLDTDYVILGDAPARPRKPDDTDPEDAWNLYQERLKAFNRFQTVEKLAKSNQTPRLSGKRFLDLIGYIPTKKNTD